MCTEETVICISLAHSNCKHKKLNFSFLTSICPQLLQDLLVSRVACAHTPYVGVCAQATRETSNTGVTTLPCLVSLVLPPALLSDSSLFCSVMLNIGLPFNLIINCTTVAFVPCHYRNSSLFSVVTNPYSSSSVLWCDRYTTHFCLYCTWVCPIFLGRGLTCGATLCCWTDYRMVNLRLQSMHNFSITWDSGELPPFRHAVLTRSLAPCWLVRWITSSPFYVET